MTQFKRFITSLLCLCATITTFAQIQKGNYNLGGDVTVAGAFTKSKYFNANELNLSLSPSVGKFLTDNWLVAARPILSTQIQKGDFAERSFIDEYTYSADVTRLGLELSSRYYVHLGKKTSLFGLVSGSYDRGFSHGSISSPKSGNTDGESAANFLNYQGGIGLNVSVNRDVFFETTFSYVHQEIPSSALFLTFARNESPSESILFNCSMNHFISLTKQSKENEGTPQYIKKGRRILGGNIEIWKKDGQFNSRLTPQYSGFVTDNLLLSGTLLWQSVYSGRDNNQLLGGIVSAKYYFPVKNRFFLYPQLTYIRRSTNSNGFDYYKHALNIGIGGSYFLSENVALDATFLQARMYLLQAGESDQQRLSSALGLGNVGIIYFIH
jgi:hypothetical protein